MTNEEFQKLVLEKFDRLESQMKENTDLLHVLIESNRITNAEIESIKLSTVGKEAIERIEVKSDKILATQTVQGESLNILALRQLKTESEIEALKKRNLNKVTDQYL